MSYREWAPPASLATTVDCLWTHRVTADANPVLPDGCSDVIWRSGHGAFVAGPDTGPNVVDLEPGALLVGVRFRPGVGGAALGVPLAEVRDRRVDLPDLTGVDLDPDVDPATAADALTRFAAERLDGHEPDPAVGEAISLLTDPRADLVHVSRTVGVSERQLRRRFQAAVGYGPKTLQRVLRFRSFLDRLPEGDLAGAAAECGFADQSHLNRECKDLAGLTPAQLAATRT